jgi:hypothetical protein
MAQTKRRRKHRGTQAGTVEARGRTGRRPAPTDSRAAARERRLERLDKPPTWRSALNKAAIAAAVFAVLVVVIFRRPVVAAISLAAVMVLVYLPMSYYTDLFIHRRRQRSKQRHK